uniref:Uncharacterized protein n=1 Tax=Molossus molossus TaxID=27622 RepID=A0A7J8CS27_MOLMO|nr:hypothetical protein HJG59_009765 [Molossus molossus]
MRVAANHSYFSGLILPPTPPFPVSPCPISPHSDPTPQVLETLMSYVLGNGISWSLLIIIGHFMPSSTHTHFPSTQLRPDRWKRNRNVLVPYTAPFPLSPLPLFFSPPTIHFCPLSFEQGGVGESSVSVQPVWRCWGFPLILHCFLHHPPPLPPTLTTGCHHYHYKPCD